MGCGETIGRVVLGIFNLIFFLGSALMLAFGITASVNPGAIATVFNTLLPPDARNDLQNTGVDISGIVVSNSVFMIIIGVIGLVIAGLGFFGACCMIKWMLLVYAILIILLLLGEVALIIFAAVYTDTFKTVIQKGMFESLVKEFKEDFTISNGSLIAPKMVIPLSWASVQFKEKCCGAYSYKDYENITWAQNFSSIFPGQAKVPISCCNSSGISYNNGNAALTSPSDVSIIGCLQGNPAFIYERNCYDAVSDEINSFIQQYKGIAIGIAAGIAGIELILIIISIALFCTHERSDKFV